MHFERKFVRIAANDSGIQDASEYIIHNGGKISVLYFKEYYSVLAK
jgi:hypothetical protein